MFKKSYVLHIGEIHLYFGAQGFSHRCTQKYWYAFSHRVDLYRKGHKECAEVAKQIINL